MHPRPRSAEYFDGWYADRVATTAVDELMNRHTGFPPGTRAGVVPAEAIPELAEELRLSPGSTLLDLACGRGPWTLGGGCPRVMRSKYDGQDLLRPGRPAAGERR